MELQDLYNLIESHLDNCTDQTPGNTMGKRVKLPIPPEHGGGWATGETALEAVRALISRLNMKLRKESPLFCDCLDKWLEIKKGEEKSPSTIIGYETLSKNRIKPFFEGRKINEITSDDIQLYFNSIMALSKSTSDQSRAILTAVFERADRNGYLDRNPMQYKYDMSRKEGEKVVLQDQDLLNVIEDLDKLLETGDIRDYLYFCFLCFTALRRGEILGLKWEDIDFENDEIHVVRNVTFPNGTNNPVVRIPKDGSCGIVHLQSGLKDRISGYVREPDDYVIFRSREDPQSPITKSMFTKLFQRCKNKINLNGATSHSFRASYVSMMNAHCDHIDPKALQGVLRHKTPDLALKVYTKKNQDKTMLVEKEYDAWLCERLAE